MFYTQVYGPLRKLVILNSGSQLLELSFGFGAHSGYSIKTNNFEFLFYSQVFLLTPMLMCTYFHVKLLSICFLFSFMFQIRCLASLP